jgi:ATP-dependent helicase HrpA
VKKFQKYKNRPAKLNLSRPIPKYTAHLPIVERKDEIIKLIQTNQLIIVAGETGSGKTTQLPVMCLEAGRGITGKIGCTQPRRIAATSIAARVAGELNCALGRDVGYKIRFSDFDSDETCIKFMTDGILLTEIESDPELFQYDTLIIDEAHERSLNIDFILGYLRMLVKRRPDLKIIISSATIDTDLFSKSFNNAPVIEVSGRVFPVEVLYLDPKGDDDEITEDDVDYVKAAVRAAQDMLDLYGSGDMLIFMPTERDIHETCDKLKGLRLDNTLILPLFSRLSRAEQDLIFKTIDKRKIVVATNIAETSITVPGIRYVVDTGLARISRYLPRLRTNRLPIEPISRAAAEQRKGRCGRVMDGVCVRLYSEKEFLAREMFTLPEIKRSNLAGVVLSMIAHHLGDIETFPFLEPPSKQAISEAFAQLRELGALNDKNELTYQGQEMAHLPLDPHISRIVIAARKESSLREIKIIAAALSIVDPRERPMDKQNEADTMHKKFADPASDFLLYVKLWDACRGDLQALKTQGQMRKFCKEHFLSYIRMQEWFDVHQQIHETLKQLRGFADNMQVASYEAIHRALVTGLLSNCAVKSENGRYTAARGREVLIFPGSSLSGKGVEWIISHEIFETSQVFARTAAVIKPQWLEELGEHLCSRSYSEPYFDKETGVVKSNERVSLFGLPVATHNGIRFGRVNASKATDVFIWKGLVEEELESYLPFYIHNKRVRKEVELLEAKLRNRSLFAGEGAIAEFYQKRISDISTVHELNKLVKENGDKNFLFMTQEDILTTDLNEKTIVQPDNVVIGGKKFPLKYNFSPGKDDDGITLTIEEKDASCIPKEFAGWVLPHLWPGRIAELLQTLPKELRKKLQPIQDKAKDIASVLVASPEPFTRSVSKALKVLYKIEIDETMFIEDKISPHLLLRVEIKNDKGAVVASGRGDTVLADTVQNVSNKKLSPRNSSWDSAFAKQEKYNLTEWNFGDLPESIKVVPVNSGLPIYAYPALVEDLESVNLIMVVSKDDADRIHRSGISKLLELALEQEFSWIEKDLRFDQPLKLLCVSLGGHETIKNILLDKIRAYLLTIPDPVPRTKTAFESLVSNVKNQAKRIGYEALSLIEKIMQLYNENMARINNPRYVNGELKKQLKNELKMYLDLFITGKRDYGMLKEYPRYMKAFSFRIDRAFNEPFKYAEKRRMLEFYWTKIEKIDCGAKEQVEMLKKPFSMMIEEYAISLFAQQEVKTLYPISPQRLDKKLEEITALCRKQVK